MRSNTMLQGNANENAPGKRGILSTVALFGFQFGFYHVFLQLSSLRNNQLWLSWDVFTCLCSAHKTCVNLFPTGSGRGNDFFVQVCL